MMLLPRAADYERMKQLIFLQMFNRSAVLDRCLEKGIIKIIKFEIFLKTDIYIYHIYHKVDGTIKLHKRKNDNVFFYHFFKP